MMGLYHNLNQYQFPIVQWVVGSNRDSGGEVYYSKTWPVAFNTIFVAVDANIFNSGRGTDADVRGLRNVNNTSFQYCSQYGTRNILGIGI